MSETASTPTVTTPAGKMPCLPGSEAITQSAKSNLALSFAALPEAERRAMSVFYAFCRVVDDVADSTELPIDEKQRQLGEWRQEIRRAYLDSPLTPLGQEMAQIIRTYLIPPTPLEEILSGMEMDMSILRYPDFALLDQYCYRVASAVGLVSIDIFGCRHPQTRDYAVALGMAFQLTNILRDVKKDASFGRIYLPQDELAAFGVTEADIIEGRFSEKMRQLFRFQHHRARHYFAKAHRLMVPSDRPKLLAAEIMREVYEELLNEIERHKFDVMTKPVMLSRFEKARLIFRAKAREKRAEPRPPAPKKVVVLGAGYAGLAAANELTLRGHDVTLVEGRALLGGRAHSFADTKSGLILDNGQHILMGCYHETLALLEQLGARNRLFSPPSIAVPFVSEKKGRSVLAATAPEPFHLLSALLAYGELNASDKMSAVKLALRLRLGQKPQAHETVATWMQRWKQTPNLVRALWEPLCIAALNEPVATASAALFATVIVRSFMSSAADSTILLSKVGLSELFAPEVKRLLEMCRGTLRVQTMVTGLRFEGTKLCEVKFSDGSSLQPEAVVSALPWHVLRALLPTESKLARACGQILDAPIVSLHFWLDKPILAEPFVGLLDSPVHWVFSRDHIHGADPSQQGHVITAVVSGARDLVDKTGVELEELTMSELRRFLPEARDVKVLHRMVYKARSATFAATPETEPLRPEGTTEWSNFWLAGDWTNTGLPATIEGAVMSGLRAARAVDAAILNPEL
jgi:squalene synthase HpnD